MPEDLLPHSCLWTVEFGATLLHCRPQNCPGQTRELSHVSIAQQRVKAKRVCFAAASKWRQEPVRGPCGGAGGEERLDGVGNSVQRELGGHGGHGGVQTAWIRLCQSRLPGKKHCRVQNMVLIKDPLCRI